MLAAAASRRPAAGLLLAALAATPFAVGAVLQHEAAGESTSASGLILRRLVTRPRWMLGQASTALGTGSQVAALSLALVAVVQPVLAAALVVALALRAVRNRQAPLRVELLGVALMTGGLAVFLLAAQLAAGPLRPARSWLGVGAAVVVAVVLVASATLFGRGARGALACGCAGGVAAGIAAVLISVGLWNLREGGVVHALAGITL